MSRGKRYNKQGTLNKKKVFAVAIAIIVIIMFIGAMSRLVKPKEKQEEKVIANSYITMYSEGKWGVINSKGEVIIEPTYDEMIVIPDKTKPVFIYQSDVNYAEEKYNSKAMDESRTPLFMDYEQVEAFQNNDENNNSWWEEKVLKVKKDSKFGMIDLSGNVIVSCEYDNIYPLKGVKNSYVVVKDGKLGLVDTTGSIIIDTQYEDIKPLTQKYEDGYIVENDASKFGIISYEKKKIVECKYTKIENIYGSNMYVVKDGSKTEVIDKDGKVVLTDGFDSVKSIDNSNLVIKKDGKYGVISREGENVINVQYDDLTYMTSEYYIAKKDNKYGIINLNNETKVDFNYTYIDYRKDEDFIEAQKEDGKSDLMDTNFEVKVTGIISKVDSENGYMKVRVGDDYEYYNFKFEKKQAKEFLKTNTLYLDKKDGKYGFINKSGVVVVDYQYEDATEQNEYGYASVKKDGKWGAIDQKGNVAVEPKYEMSYNTIINFIGKWHLAADLNANYYTDIQE